MNPKQAADGRLSPFVRFSREEWGRLRTTIPLSLSEDDVRDLWRIAEHLSLEEATEVYLPHSSREKRTNGESAVSSARPVAMVRSSFRLTLRSC